MKKKIIEKVTHMKEVTESITKHESITCNKCGKERVRDFNSGRFEDQDDELWRNDYQSFGCSFGYGSRHDMERWSFDLCEECLVEIIKDFKHVPKGFMLDSSWYIIENESIEHQKLFDDWKVNGIWEELKFKTYEELTEEYADIFNTDYINEIIKKYHSGKPFIKE